VRLSDTDRREVCVLHGWVGRAVFQRDRHDLCEAPEEASPPAELADREVDEDADEAEDEGEDKDDHYNPRRWSRAAARARGIPSKKTVAVRRITQVELAVGRAELRVLGADAPYDRPKTRGDCLWCPVCQLVRDGKSDGRDEAARRALGRDPGADQVTGRLVCGHRVAEVIHRSRPCVFIACKHALYLDVSETGSIIFNFPHLEPGQMPAKRSCSLDLAVRGGMTLEQAGVAQALTRERVRQVEVKALVKLLVRLKERGIDRSDVTSLVHRYLAGPGGELADSGADGELPSDVATLLLQQVE
jgi:hypothetical protein